MVERRLLTENMPTDVIIWSCIWQPSIIQCCSWIISIRLVQELIGLLTTRKVIMTVPSWRIICLICLRSLSRRHVITETITQLVRLLSEMKAFHLFNNLQEITSLQKEKVRINILHLLKLFKLSGMMVYGAKLKY